MSKAEVKPGRPEPCAQHEAIESKEPAAANIGMSVQLAAAEAEAAEAEAAAAQARDRAIRLQQDVQGCCSGADADADALQRRPQAATAHDDSGPWRSRTGASLSGFAWRRMVNAAVALLVCVLLAASVMMWRSQQTVQQDARNRAEFVAAARQAVVTLMSIDFNDPQGSVERIADNSTGSFRDEFLGAADDFRKVATDAKVTTKATATAAAVESMTPDSAVVLVSASSTVTNAAGADDDPRSWRLNVELQREGDQIKMSKVEFVP